MKEVICENNIRKDVTDRNGKQSPDCHNNLHIYPNRNLKQCKDMDK